MSLVYQGLYIVFTFPSNFVIDSYGVKNGVIIGTFLTTLGMFIKVFINQGFWICILGQLFAAAGQPFLSNAPTKLAAVWFG
jgi:fucose permease